MSNAIPTTTVTQNCTYCKHDFPLDRTNCPHCGQPQLFPNVTLARLPAEVEKLKARYAEVLDAADARGCRDIVEQFSDECQTTSAIMRFPLMRLVHQLGSGFDIFAPYRDLERLRLRMGSSGSFNFEKLRPQAEIELLGNEKHVGLIHYACLSLDGKGMGSYGQCIIKLAESMIGHRASCFEGNSAVIYDIERNFDRFLRSE